MADLKDRAAWGSRASPLLQGFVLAGGSCGSWLARDGISAVWRNDRGARGSRASSLLQGVVVAGGSCGSWLASDGITAVWRSDRGARGSRASSLLQGVVVAGGNFVGAGLPAMASLRSGGTTGGLEDREQARSYRGLWWLAVILWELACQRWHLCGLAERPRCSGSRASSLLQGVVVAGGNFVGAGLPAMASLLSGGTTGGLEDRDQARSYRGLWWLAVILWELACQRWHLCGLAERPRCSGSRASSLLQGFVVAGVSCGSWLASDGISAIGQRP